MGVKPHVILYLDILGYKNIIASSTNENDYIANHNALNIKDDEIDGSIRNAQAQGYTGKISRGDIGDAITDLNTSINSTNVEINQKQKEYKREATVDSFNQK